MRRKQKGMKSKKKRKVSTSLCWSCANCYSYLCKWVDEQKPVWRSAKQRVIKEGHGLTYTVFMVTDCDNYIPENFQQAYS